MPDNTFDEMTFACISFNKKCNNVFFIYNQIDHGVRVCFYLGTGYCAGPP